MRLGETLGAQRETLMGLSGVGDLILTCTDNQSRNRRLGLAIAKGKSVAEAQAEIKQVVEGVRVARVTGQGQLARPHAELRCDLVAVAIGYSPAGNLAWQAGARFAYDETVVKEARMLDLLDELASTRGEHPPEQADDGDAGEGRAEQPSEGVAAPGKTSEDDAGAKDASDADEGDEGADKDGARPS
jgi:hypothetical protein